LVAAGYDTPYKLIGKYLSLRDRAMSTREHVDAFYAFLADDVRINSNRAGIVRAVAEKVNVMLPGTFVDADFAPPK
jgi:hypothetical protein